MMKLDKMVLANAFALTTGILWVICSAIAFSFPQLYWQSMVVMMHGINMSVMGGVRLTFTSFLVGGITWIVVAWLSGLIFGWSWEQASKNTTR